jgi:hypothetical protein
MTLDPTSVLTLLVENQAFLKTLLSLQVNTLSEQTGESRDEINKKVNAAIEENMRSTWKGFYESFPEARILTSEKD